MSPQKFILLLEDDLDIQEAIQGILEEEGYEIKSTPNGTEGLQFLSSAERIPDLILLDLMMPEMNGYEFRIKQLSDPKIAAIPTVVLSARNQIEDVEQLSFNEYVKKPLDLITLIDVVKRHLPQQK